MLSIHEYRKIEIITANGSCDRYVKLSKHSILTVSSKRKAEKQCIFHNHNSWLLNQYASLFYFSRKLSIIKSFGDKNYFIDYASFFYNFDATHIIE